MNDHSGARGPGRKSEITVYQNLRRRARELALVSSASSLLAWDQETYMPPKALTYRAEQLGFLSGWSHRMWTAPEVGDWISACEQHGFAPGSIEAANVREWRRQYDRQTKLPSELVEEFRRVTAASREAWLEARRDSDFARFAPALDTILKLCRRMADRWGYEQSPYDALLEEYEPGARSGPLQALFAELRPQIVAMLEAITQRKPSSPVYGFKGNFPVAAQQAFNLKVARAMGFDFEAGRIDTTAHPFCSGIGPGDCRLTTRYHEDDFTRSLYGVLHEAGHGLYELGLRDEDFGMPVGTAVSLGVHESQSRLWENHVGRCLDFWRHWHPVACRYFPDLKQLSPEQITARVNRVEPSFIRVQADPVTYDLHIILRFEIEKQLIEGKIQVADLPAFWNEQFKQLLGLTVPDDAHGCLQDIHWSQGIFGYFPTYTLGNLNAAQLFQAACSSSATVDTGLKRGEYAPLLQWLREHVHQHGMRYQAGELIEHATGKPIQPAAHLAFLQRQFSQV
jgi:carboxypeptidase Taq